jgi:hypothetical protein
MSRRWGELLEQEIIADPGEGRE